MLGTRLAQIDSGQMGFDSQLKRFYPLIILAMIALAAFFQAGGIGQMLGAAVGDAPGGKTGVSTGLLPGSGSVTISGKPILARNPFDSITGPLAGDTSPIPNLPGTEDAPVIDPGDPYTDPKCSFGRVLLISESADPDWSFASIQDQGGESKLRRVGDDVSDHQVVFVGWDRVWLSKTNQRCQLKLGDKSNVKSTPKKTTRKRKRKRKRGSRAISADMKAKISKVSDTEFNIQRSLVDEVLENQAELMKSARIVPDKQGDDVLGIKMFGLRNGTLLNELGFKNGDRLESINGFEMSDPQKALEAYGRLRTADGLKVKINRKGSPITLDFNIQ